MTQAWSQIYLVRHGETAWTITGQHTGRTDIPLTERGEQDCRALGERLKGINFSAVYTSPLLRARQTCELAGFGTVAKPDADLMEWNYGEYESRTSADIRKERPDWSPVRDGFPGGESAAEVAKRAQNVLERIRTDKPNNILLFSHGHFLRFLAVGWLGLELQDMRLFLISPASISILGYEHNLSQPVIRLWNDVG